MSVEETFLENPGPSAIAYSNSLESLYVLHEAEGVVTRVSKEQEPTESKKPAILQN